jgi:hypothetical protein
MARGSYVDSHAADRVLFRTSPGSGSPAERWSWDKSLLRVHLLPRWGDWPITKVDHSGVQQWVAELGRQLAPATVRECYRVLSLVLRSAVQAPRIQPVRGCSTASSAAAGGAGDAHAG